MKIEHDEPLDEIWAIRRAIARRHGFDPQKQAKALKARQARMKSRMFHREDTVVTAR